MFFQTVNVLRESQLQSSRRSAIQSKEGKRWLREETGIDDVGGDTVAHVVLGERMVKLRWTSLSGFLSWTSCSSFLADQRLVNVRYDSCSSTIVNN